MLSIFFIFLHCLKCVLMKATCEREIFKLFQVTKCKGFYSFKLEKNTKRKILKLNILSCGKNSAFSCRLQTANQDHLFTALFTNMRILKFRSQPTIPFFAAVNHLILTDLLGNKTLLNGFKRSCFVICGFQSVLCFSVSRFVTCDRNYD